MHYYHYTDINATHSILKNRKIWLTDLRYMNDTNELREGLEHISLALEYTKIKHPSPDSLGQGFKDRIRFVEHELESINGNFEFEEPLFVLSLSERDDMLSQWRAYGKYSISLDSELLERADLKVTPCIYSQSEKLRLASIALDNFLQAGLGKPFDYSAAAQEFTCLVQLAATFKHEGFKEERETRLILTGDGHRVQYRSRGNMLIPYIEVTLPLQAIRGVRVGPIRDSALAFASLSGLVTLLEEEVASIDGGYTPYEIDVAASGIPYRD